jgi:hypothetical protein
MMDGPTADQGSVWGRPNQNPSTIGNDLHQSVLFCDVRDGGYKVVSSLFRRIGLESVLI